MKPTNDKKGGKANARLEGDTQGKERVVLAVKPGQRTLCLH
jgi:hypothetical protein